MSGTKPHIVPVNFLHQSKPFKGPLTFGSMGVALLSHYTVISVPKHMRSAMAQYENGSGAGKFVDHCTILHHYAKEVDQIFFSYQWIDFDEENVMNEKEMKLCSRQKAFI